MFSTLRNKLLFLNLSITSGVIIAAFAFVYFIAYSNLQADIRQRLQTLLFVGISTLIVILGVSFYFANRAIKPIQGAWEKQKQFVADASHELKTPLSIIHANCDALVASQEDTIQNQMKWIDYIRAGTDRMGKLVQDLLILAKTDDERITLHKEHFNLSEVVDTVSQSMEAAIASKRLSLTRSIEPDLIVSGDPDGVSQVVGILLDNAIKYASPGGWIRLSLTRSGRRIEFSITNNGRGIAKEDLPKVFDRFFRADRSRTYKDGSYGLGLSIAQSIIKQHASVIKVRSVENQATTFSFSLAK